MLGCKNAAKFCRTSAVEYLLGGAARMPIAANITELARRFATALDSENYEAARAVLAADCRCEARTRVVVGPDGVINSHRRSGETARRLFDAVDYGSEPLNAGTDLVCVTFSDRISKHGRTHVFQSRQWLHFTPDGLVARITHEDLAGERERLLEFCAVCGVTLSDETGDITASPIASANAGRPACCFPDAVGPAWLRSSLGSVLSRNLNRFLGCLIIPAIDEDVCRAPGTHTFDGAQAESRKYIQRGQAIGPRTERFLIRLLGLCGGAAEHQESPRNSILNRESARRLEGRELLC